MTPKDKRSLAGYIAGYNVMVQEALDGLEVIGIDPITEATQAIKAGTGIVWLAGNGGSGALASHMATDLQLSGIRAQSLTDHTALSCYGNDWGFEYAFLLQATKMIRPEDVLVLISTSGNSKNITRIPEHYQRFPNERPSTIITLTGKGGGRLAGLGDINIVVPSQHTGVVQDLHQVILHTITYWLMGAKG